MDVIVWMLDVMVGSTRFFVVGLVVGGRREVVRCCGGGVGEEV